MYKKIIFILVFLVSFLGVSYGNDEKSDLMRPERGELTIEKDGTVIYKYMSHREISKKISSEKTHFWLLRYSGYDCTRITPNICLDRVRGKTEYDVSVLLSVYDDKGYLGYKVLYNTEDNGIYAFDHGDTVEEIMYDGKLRRCRGICRYYRIGEGRIEQGIFRPLFVEGAWFSYRKKEFLNTKDDNELKIHIPGVFKKPDFVTYYIVVDGKVIQGLPD